MITTEQRVALALGSTIIQLEAAKAEIEALRSHVAALEAAKNPPSSDGIERAPGIYEADQLAI